MSRGQRLSVLLTTEGTYPYHKGGVSTWCHALTSKVTDVDFTILALAMHPYVERAYDLAPNVRRLVTVPIWGTEDPAEYGRYESAAEFLRCRWHTTADVIARNFVPAYTIVLGEAFTTSPSRPVLTDALVAMHEYFDVFDYQRTMSDRLVWEAFVQAATDAWRRAEPGAPPPALGELADAWRWLGRLLTVLATPIPRTDITHSAAAAFCGLPCIIAKARWGTPYLLTEHGVYVREQYLNLGRSIPSLFVRWILSRVIGAVADLNYAHADQVSPVCQYNTRWERWRGVQPERIQVIYNGVDPARFSPAELPIENDRPLVASVGLIFPLKGQLDLIEASSIIRRTIPDVEVRLYGSASDQDYFEECQARVHDLGLHDTVVFAGTTREPWDVYRRADVVAMASISEAFPYALIEAMLCGAAIVATDVGGVREALGEAGILVDPRDPEALAAAIATLVASAAERRRLGAAARARALELFTEERFVDAYRAAYRSLSSGSRPGAGGRRSSVTPFPAPSQRALRGYTPFAARPDPGSSSSS
jgi:glycosyltransferase involved in cell wall biosynthesis